MLGEKLYALRRSKNISQEEFANVLNTSRQAISKWERNGSKPDVDKLIKIAKLFNVSIDYLLSYEINYSDIDAFADELKDCYRNNNFIININDIRLWCSKYPNNFNLHLRAAEYLYVSYFNNNNDEYLNLALSYINKAITLFTPEYYQIVSLNDLHSSVAEIYLTQQKYEFAKNYVEKNSVHGCEVLLAKCDLALKKYDDALKEASEIYLKSTSDIMNASFVQIMALLKTKKIQEAYDLINWTISFVNSIQNDDDFFEGIFCPFLYLKASCEQLLNINCNETIKKLKDINHNTINLNISSESKSIKHYFGKPDILLLSDSNIKNTFKEIINQTEKGDIYYEPLINIYNEIFGGEIDE